MIEKLSDVGATKVTWEQLKEAAEKSFFCIWVLQREVAWAKIIWHAAEKRGLTTYSDQKERVVVLFRFIALSAIYADYCELRFEENAGYDYETSISDLRKYGFEIKEEDLPPAPISSFMDQLRMELCAFPIEFYSHSGYEKKGAERRSARDWGEQMLLEALESTTIEDREPGFFGLESAKGAGDVIMIPYEEYAEEKMRQVYNWMCEGMPTLH